MRISDWSSDVCSSDLARLATPPRLRLGDRRMQFRRPGVAHFPDALLTGYRRFRETGWKHERERWTDLAEGQSPRVMVIACSDSRADPATIFDTAPGEIFTVRNVANLVPPLELGGGRHGVSAALAFEIGRAHV